MLLTPPDVISQALLAFPMWLLFETGIILARFNRKGHKKEKQEKAAEEAQEPHTEADESQEKG